MRNSPMSNKRAINILLVRHGQPDLAWPDLCTADEFLTWSERYRDCGLDKHSQPPPDLIDQIRQHRRIRWVSSPLKRAHQSCAVLSCGAELLVLEELAEVRLPSARGTLGEYSAQGWIEKLILAYNAGLLRGSESPEQLERKAKSAAQKLLAHAASAECVVAVGHGLINRLVAEALVRLGVKLHASQSGEYWRWQYFKAKAERLVMTERGAVISL